MENVLQPFNGVTFPEGEYAINPVLPFRIQFVSPRTVRIRIQTGPGPGVPGAPGPEQPSPMLVGEPPRDTSWKMTPVAGGYRYASAAGSVTILENPWHVEIRDAQGRILTRTNHTSDYATQLEPALPFAFIRRSSDYSRSVAAVFSLSPGEKLFGGGESFTRLDKRGQKLVLWSNDANGVETNRMYKPIPFFMSNRGYGMFVHTSAPATFDFGASVGNVNQLLLGDDELDLFVFLGQPKEILDEYTKLTGKASMPPLWSFGLWMSRITYYSEEETRAVAAKLRQNRIPDDVIHLDTGWFETDWRCDYQFSATRFKDPAKMIADLKRDGFHISLWQLPYFVPKNSLFPEILAKGLAVKDGKGNLPYEDAVLDFTNPATVAWYQEKIGGLLKMGVGAIKVDFGEAAPLTGVYANGRSGFYEHNLYPLRYNKAVAEITRQISGENIMWARSAWAGSQRYPLHWGGDSGAGWRHGGDPPWRPLLRHQRLHLLESRHRRLRSQDPRRTVPPLDAVWDADLPQPLPRDSSQGALGVQRRVPGRFPPRRRDEVQVDALRLRPGQRRQPARPANGACAVYRIPGRPRLVAGGR